MDDLNLTVGSEELLEIEASQFVVGEFPSAPRLEIFAECRFLMEREIVAFAGRESSVGFLIRVFDLEDKTNLMFFTPLRTQQPEVDHIDADGMVQPLRRRDERALGLFGNDRH